MTGLDLARRSTWPALRRRSGPTGAAWSPDDSTVYVATTGLSTSQAAAPDGPRPAGSPCDAAMAFPATPDVGEPDVDQPDRL